MKFDISKFFVVNYGTGISCEPVLRWLLLDLTGDKSTLVQVMAWCRQATSHYLSQCWPRSMSPYGTTRLQWVNFISIININIMMLFQGNRWISKQSSSTPPNTSHYQNRKTPRYRHMDTALRLTNCYVGYLRVCETKNSFVHAFSKIELILTRIEPGAWFNIKITFSKKKINAPLLI